MPQGLQVWDATATLVLDTNTNVGRVHGSIVKNGSGAAGNQVIPSLASGTPFFIVIQPYASGYYDRVTVTIVGTTISWGAYGTGFTIYYGTY